MNEDQYKELLERIEQLEERVESITSGITAAYMIYKRDRDD